MDRPENDVMGQDRADDPNGVQNIIQDRSRQLLNRRVNLRYRSASHGYWVAFLLPVAVYLSEFEMDEMKSTTAVTILSVNALLLSYFQWMELNFSTLLDKLRKINVGLSVTIMLICILHGGNIYEVSSYVALHFTFPYVYYNLIKQHPRSFTFGEGVLLTSGFTFMFWEASQTLPFPPPDFATHPKPDSLTVPLFIQFVFFGTVLGARLILLFQKPWKLFILEEMLCLWAKYCIIAFCIRLPIQNDDVSLFLVTWPFKFLVATNTRVNLIVFWASVSFLTGVYLILRTYTSPEKETTTIDRKLFHLAVVLVFLPGIIWDFTLIYCCSAVVFFLFVLVECLRVLRFEPVGIQIGELINENLKGFRDHQDQGKLLLTPIYLLVGCSLPLWLTGIHDSSYTLKNIEFAATLSGILSIGIGDTFASIGGTYFGRTHWRATRKTVEGTLCSIMAQIIFLYLMVLSGLLPFDPASITGLIAGSIVNAVVEGNTDQIDNIVLPLVTFIVIHACGILLKV